MISSFVTVSGDVAGQRCLGGSSSDPKFSFRSTEVDCDFSALEKEIEEQLEHGAQNGFKEPSPMDLEGLEESACTCAYAKINEIEWYVISFK